MLNIIVSADDGYAVPLAVMLRSLCEHNAEIRINIFLYAEGMCESSIRKLSDSLTENAAITLLPVVNVAEILKPTRALTWRGNYSAYNMLFCVDLLPDNIKRAVFLDADMVVCGDIGELMNVDLNGKMLGMAAFAPVVGKRDAKWYNSGTVVFDVCQWKERKAGEKSVRFLQNNAVRGDEAVLNYAFEKDIQDIDFKFNCVHYFDSFSRRMLIKGYGYSNENYEKMSAAIKDARILHLFSVNCRRVWNVDWRGRAVEYSQKVDWDNYLSRTAFSDYRKTACAEESTARISDLLKTLLPEAIYVKIFAWFYDRQNLVNVTVTLEDSNNE